MNIPFLRPTIKEEDIEAVNEVLRGGWLVLQKNTDAFEQQFSSYLGCRDAVLTNSCTCAIHLALIMLDVKEGDEVIVPALTYVSSVNPILHCGASPVFVDVEDESGLIDLDLVEAAITPKTVGIIPVHIYGQMIDMKRIKSIADSHGLFIIEDAAHAVESERDGIQPGANSFAAAFSFHVAKNITAGTGGALAINDSLVADRARVLRRDGVRNVGNIRIMEELGHKYLATDFQAAMLSSQLSRIEEQWKKRKQIYDRYAEAFSLAGIKFNPVLPNSKHAYHMIVVYADPEKRDTVRNTLGTNGIQTSVHYNPVTLEPFYREKFGFKKGDFPVAEHLGTSCITLPLYPLLSSGEQEYIIEKVCENI
ncbi:MAG: DegT/DnrJ/EryC1/StrS family aminotransferase [Candidatus Peribacteraceae bacterium]|nr:DegT/DnrJ/EryC1/StrS family aminotransferase [Candidatus Peribacteraceae bacterium]